jgi:hypothetical protein
MRFYGDGTSSADNSGTVKSTPVSRQPLERSWLTVWPIFFMVWVAVWASIGQVRRSTFGLITSSYTSQQTMQLSHTNTYEDMHKMPLRAIKSRKEELEGRRDNLGSFNERWCTVSVHYPMKLLLEQLRILPETLTTTNFALELHARPYRKKSNSTHNHKSGWPKDGYERFSSTRSKSSRRDIGLSFRTYQQMVLPRGPDPTILMSLWKEFQGIVILMSLWKEFQGIVTILVRFIIKILPEGHQYVFRWEIKHFFMRGSLRPGQTVSPTPISGSANPSRPVARSSKTVSLDGVVQGL